MKILSACQAGICRSAAMANELKRHGHDVLVVGLGYNDEGTIRMLAEWADKIVVMQKELIQLLPAEHLQKAVIADIGPDVWTSSADPDIRRRVQVIVDAWKDGNWSFENFSLRPNQRAGSS